MRPFASRIAAALLAAILALPLVAAPVGAQDAPFCPQDAPRFIFGFADLKAYIGAPMGDALTCEFPDPNGTGDVHQQTTTGLAFWRKSTNTPTFTNGWLHWGHTPTGWVCWTGDSIDPSPEATLCDQPTVAASPQDTLITPITLDFTALPTLPPASIYIPKLGTQARIVPVGLEEDGAMASPTDPDTVGWYQFGASVGRPGNAVLAGHVDWGGQLRAFGMLKTLVPGDRVQVTDAFGNVLSYRVTWATWMDAYDAPVAEVFAQGPQEEVTLITCGGVFDTTRREYLSRFVVRAVRDRA